jgi:hypothetical protein
MFRPVLLAAAVLAATPALAAGPGTLVAVPEAQPTRAALVTRSAAWSLRGNAYITRTAERPTILCELVARDAGRLSSFSVNGTALAGDALARCNRHAR